MCGITGFIDFVEASQSPSLINEMTDLLNHRGPDNRGIICLPGLAMGHRRLAIIDLASGKQPMNTIDGRYWLVFNGEIFNFRQLKSELEAAGLIFKTSSDTEVILNGFQHLGNQFFSQLNGQFALAIYDTAEHTLTLARDSGGEKPLFLIDTGSAIAFASEIKSLIQFMDARKIPKNLNEKAIINFLSLNYVPFGETFLSGVAALPQGQVLTARTNGIRRFENLRPRSSFALENWNNRSDHQILDEFTDLFENSVRLRLESDVPVGLFLSGGIDSTAVAVASKKHTDLTALIADFDEAGFSEAKRAVEIAQSLRMKYEICPIRVDEHDVPQLIQSIVYHADTPLGDSSSLAVYLLSQMASKRVKVVLSGDGGDELFGGYLTYRATLFSEMIPKPLRPVISQLCNFSAKMLDSRNTKVGLQEKLSRFGRALTLPPAAAHFAWNGMFLHHEKEYLLSDRLRQALTKDTFESMASYTGLINEKIDILSLCEADRLSYLVDDILVKVDRMSMAHGLETRPIFLDYRLVDFAKRLPKKFLINSRWSKLLLRQYIHKFAPEINLNVSKRGFSIPVHMWFRNVLKEFWEDTVLSDDFRSRDLFNFVYIEKLWTLHQSGKENLGFHLWGLMVIALWLKNYMPRTISKVID